MSGIDSMRLLRPNVKVAQAFKSVSDAQMESESQLPELPLDG